MRSGSELEGKIASSREKRSETIGEVNEPDAEERKR